MVDGPVEIETILIDGPDVVARPVVVDAPLAAEVVEPDSVV